MIKKYLKQDPSVIDDVKDLYLSAFPEDERPPWFFIYDNNMKTKEDEIIAYYEDDEFIGFTFLTSYQDIVYLSFFAIKEDKRNQGYGSLLLEELKELYKDKVLLICFEEVNKKYEDYPNRLRRENFYKRHGFIDNEMLTNEAGVIYQSSYIGKHKVSFKEYIKIFDLVYGKGTSDTYLREVK